MRRLLVRYRTTPEKAEENGRLIRKVFQELQTKSPAGVRYLVLNLDDGTFVHFAAIEDDANPVSALPAFRSFQSEIAKRYIEPPQINHATVVGNYRMLGE